MPLASSVQESLLRMQQAQSPVVQLDVSRMAGLYAAEHRRSNMLLFMLFIGGLGRGYLHPGAFCAVHSHSAHFVLLYCGLFLLVGGVVRIAASGPPSPLSPFSFADCPAQQHSSRMIADIMSTIRDCSGATTDFVLR